MLSPYLLRYSSCCDVIFCCCPNILVLRHWFIFLFLRTKDTFFNANQYLFFFLFLASSSVGLFDLYLYIISVLLVFIFNLTLCDSLLRLEISFRKSYMFYRKKDKIVGVTQIGQSIPYSIHRPLANPSTSRCRTIFLGFYLPNVEILFYKV